LWCRNYINRKGEKDAPPLIDAPTARVYGKWLGERYRNKPHVVWVLGGDAEPKYPETFNAMAVGIKEGVGGADKALITYHPKGTPDSSATWFHERPWLDFNMIQSSHTVWKPNYVEIARDYALRPAKPVVEGEPCYENHPIGHKPANGHFNDWHVRVKAYWSVFAGGCGFTYGGNGVWQMDRDGKPPHRASHFTLPWDKALDLPGATQMKHLRRLMESRPVLSRVPDEGTVLASPTGEKEDRVQVTRGADRTWAMYYLTTGQRVSAQVTNLKGPTVAVWWFDPRDGKTYDPSGRPTAKPFATLPITGGKKAEFDPPGDPGDPSRPAARRASSWTGRRCWCR
jgi:hypothetical protein